MVRLEIRRSDRVHMIVWRLYPSAEGDPGWRAEEAVNGIPIRFGPRFMTWREAMDYALREVAS